MSSQIFKIFIQLILLLLVLLFLIITLGSWIRHHRFENQPTLKNTPTFQSHDSSAKVKSTDKFVARGSSHLTPSLSGTQITP